MLEVRQEGRRVLVVELEDELELGRDCDGLLLADDEVSRRHALFTGDADGVSVADLGSTNGTFVDGVRVEGHRRLEPGSVVRLGSTEVRVRDPQPTAGAPAAPRGTTVTPQGPRGTVVSRGGAATGEVVVGPAVATTTEIRATSIDRVAASVATEGPAAIAGAPTGGDDTVTIVFSDIESSTERAMALGDQHWYEVLGIHNGIIRKRLAEFGGREVKSQGDGFMLTFPSARRAVQCCIAVQEDLAAFAESDPESAVRVRMGVHTGEAIVDEDGDLFGKHIIVAARIANLALGAQILASGLTSEITSSRGDLRFAPPEQVQLKGIEGTYQVCAVLWGDGA
jgi:class 3 adenylate cyclase